jgi:hypothetical protein
MRLSSMFNVQFSNWKLSIAPQRDPLPPACNPSLLSSHHAQRLILLNRNLQQSAFDLNAENTMSEGGNEEGQGTSRLLC